MSKDILIVDDEAAIREVVGAILEDEGYRPRFAANSDEALREAGSREPSLVLLDIWLEGSQLDGVQILERLRADHPHLPVIMFSGHGTIETAVAAIKKGAYDFIEKPFKSDRLLLAISRALETSRLRRENAELRDRSLAEVDLIGASPAIARVRQTIERVAPTGSRVFIAGALPISSVSSNARWRSSMTSRRSWLASIARWMAWSSRSDLNGFSMKS